MGVFYEDKVYGIKVIYMNEILDEKIYNDGIFENDIKQIYNNYKEKYGHDNIQLEVYRECTATHNNPALTEKVWQLWM